MWSGKCPQLLCIIPIGMLCLSAISMMFVNDVGKNGIGVFHKLCPIGFLVVCKCMSVLLYPVVMSYVDCGDDW